MTDHEEIDYSAYLPEPTPLRLSAVVEYTWGEQHFKMLVSAANVRREKWDDGSIVPWLHCKAVQFFGELPKVDIHKSALTLMIPAEYVTSVTDGPRYRVVQGRKTVDIGVFPPTHPRPEGSLGVAEVEERIGRLLSSERN